MSRQIALGAIIAFAGTVLVLSFWKPSPEPVVPVPVAAPVVPMPLSEEPMKTITLKRDSVHKELMRKSLIPTVMVRMAAQDGGAAVP